MKKKIIAIITLTVIVGLSLYVQIKEKKGDGNSLFVSGNIEVTEVDVSFKLPGRVTERLVSEGEWIEKGVVVAYLDDRELKDEVAVRVADVAAQQAFLLEQERGYLPEEVAQAEARLKQASAEYTRQKIDFQRQKELWDEKVISEREYDASKASYDISLAKFREAKEALDFLLRGIREERIDQARAKLQGAQDALSLANIRLNDAILYSPISGFVLSENVEGGEYVTQGTPIVTVGDLHDVWLRAYIPETELGKVKLGQKVDVTTDTYPGKIYEGKVVFISSEAEFTPKNIQTEKERVKLVYRIKVDIDNPDMELKPGMPADGVISLQ